VYAESFMNATRARASNIVALLILISRETPVRSGYFIPPSGLSGN
jgi:hypothetical protein